jgi:integrase/recombinase XerD
MTYTPINIDDAVRKECKRRRYSNRTIQTYLFCIRKFLNFNRKSIDKISKKDVRTFLGHLSDNERSGNTMNTYYMAIKFLFEQVLEKRMWIDIHYSKIPKKLPIVLTKEEVNRLINAIDNEKHRLMIEMMYGAGLRVSELINLKVKDLELDKSYGFVRHGKGGKDRLFIIANRLKESIKNLIKKENLSLESYLFNSNRKSLYSIRSLQQIIKKAIKKAELNKRVSCHTLRHSFATHLIENGYDVSAVQSLLGHKSPETTFTYLHIASPKMISIKSPLDNL